jgi:hypothetical protein
MEAPEEPASAPSQGTNGVNGQEDEGEQGLPTPDGTEESTAESDEDPTTNGAQDPTTNGAPEEEGTTITDDDNLTGTPWTLTCPVTKGVPNQVSRGVYTGIGAPKDRPKLQIRYAITPGQSWADIKRYTALKRE